jgi:hypothetical protein
VENQRGHKTAETDQEEREARIERTKEAVEGGMAQ